MEHVLSMVAFCNSMYVNFGNCKECRLLCRLFRIIPVEDKTIGTVITFSIFHCSLSSIARSVYLVILFECVVWRLFVLGIAMSIKYVVLFFLSTNVMSGLL